MNTRDSNAEPGAEIMAPDEREDHLQALKKIKGRDAYRSYAVQQFAERLSSADPSDVQEIAAGQIQLLEEYHQVVLGQARKSFWFAVVAGVSGLVLFFVAVGQLILNQAQDVAVIAGISGAIAEVVSGIGFYLYGKASGQLAEFQISLDRTQRFLLANSVCSSLRGKARDQARTELVRAMVGMSSLLPDSEQSPAAESKENGEGT